MFALKSLKREQNRLRGQHMHVTEHAEILNPSLGAGLLKNRPAIDRTSLMKYLIFFSISLLILDTIYRMYHGISYLTREKCILYSTLPDWLFLIYEYFVELLLVVIVAIFAATVVEKYSSRLIKFIPKNSMTAFLYASLIPMCSCGAIPFIRTMRGKLPFRAIITFVIAAPLLNPYIILLSTTVLGLQYAVLRCLCSLILAVISGYIVEFFFNRMAHQETGIMEGCNPLGNCSIKKACVFDETYLVLKKILPFILVAGVFGIAIEVLTPSAFLKNLDLSNNLIGTVMVILIGVPIYFCNGADVLFLQPLLTFSNLPLGTAIAFSLTSTSVCITSLVLLVRFIGKKLTLILLSCIMIITLLLSLGVHLISLVRI